MSKRKTMKPYQIGIVVVMAIVFILYTQFTTEPTEKTLTLESEQEEEEESLEANPEDFVEEEEQYKPNYMEVYSKEELIERFSSSIPGLEKAFELGLVQDVEESFVFDQDENEFMIESIWYNSMGINIIYSTEYREDEEGYHASFRHDESGAINKRGAGFFIFEDKLYSLVQIEPLKNNQGDILTQVDDNYTYDIALMNQSGDHNLLGKDLPLVFEKEKEDKYAFDVPLDEVLYEEEDLKLSLSKVKRRIHGNYLLLDYESNNSRLFAVEGEINTRSSTVMFNDYIQDPFEIEMYNTEDYVGEVDFRLSKVILISDDEFTFTLNTEEFIGKDNKVVDEKIATVNSVDYILSTVMNRQSDYIVELRVKPQMSGLQADHILSQFAKRGEEFNNVMSVVDQDGNDFTSEIGIVGSGISIPKKLFEEAEELEITISDLTYPKSITERTTFEVDLSLDE
ncbi:hypothetical protein ACTWQB_03420 [Piscibacillus sp. B03]|uniref:hypothetical protein n=1 Tax=Piscibacillus sp. B03 TaxID=3457430 RepID=UPI003FCDE4A1